MVSNVTIKGLKEFAGLVFTITGDNGSEFASHERISKELNADFYFAHPYVSWERGLNENTNGLVRQYAKKGLDFTNITHDDLAIISDKLNNQNAMSLAAILKCLTLAKKYASLGLELNSVILKKCLYANARKNTMRFLFTNSIFILLLTNTSYALPETNLSPFELVTQHIKLIGGDAALNQMKSISRYGNITFYTEDEKLEEKYCYHTDIIYPIKLREQIKGKKILHDRGSNGSSYWLWTGNSYEFTNDKKIIDEIRNTSERANRDLLWVKKEIDNYGTISSPSWAPNNSKCIQQMKGKDLVKKTYCFSASTGLLAATGHDEEYRFVSDWRSVENIKIPFQLTHYQKNKIAYEVQLRRADLNKPISDEQFTKPELATLSCE